MPVFSATAIQISGVNTPSMSSVTIDCFTGREFFKSERCCPAVHQPLVEKSRDESSARHPNFALTFELRGIPPLSQRLHLPPSSIIHQSIIPPPPFSSFRH